MFVDALPNDCLQPNSKYHVGKVVSADDLPAYIRDNHWDDVKVQGDFPLLRIYHVEREDTHVYMLFNESPNQTVETSVCLPTTGRFARLQLLEDKAYQDSTDSGEVKVSLVVGQSEILVFGDCDFLPTQPTLTQTQTWTPHFDISIAHSEDLSTFVPYMQTNVLHNITAPDKLPSFCGKVRYEFTMTLDEQQITPQAVLNLGSVGQTAKLIVNGHDCGVRVCQPYAFTIGEFLHAWENTFVIEVANTLVGKERDAFSYYMTIPPTGLLGPLTYQY